MTSPACWSRRATGPSDALADYLITWVDYALDQYLALDQTVSTQLDERLRLLARQPTGDALYDRATDHWSVEFDAGRGLVIYVVNEPRQRVVILRVLHVS